MKPNAISTTSVSAPLTALPTAKIVKHPRSKNPPDKVLITPTTPPPDEETVSRLNAIASQYPFCIRHRGNIFNELL